MKLQQLMPLAVSLLSLLIVQKLLKTLNELVLQGLGGYCFYPRSLSPWFCLYRFLFLPWQWQVTWVPCRHQMQGHLPRLNKEPSSPNQPGNPRSWQILLDLVRMLDPVRILRIDTLNTYTTWLHVELFMETHRAWILTKREKSLATDHTKMHISILSCFWRRSHRCRGVCHRRTQSSIKKGAPSARRFAELTGHWVRFGLLSPRSPESLRASCWHILA